MLYFFESVDFWIWFQVGESDPLQAAKTVVAKDQFSKSLIELNIYGYH